MHEIITLQFGQQANYIGTHYWNTQESYFTYAGQEESPVNHDTSFRAGIGPDGRDTYTPRTLIYDLKGAFGTLRRENALYSLQQDENPSQHGGWSGRTIPLRLPAIAASPYQQALDQGDELPQLTTDTVRFWSDYNHLFYHPRSVVQLSEYELNSALMPFERYATGEDLFADLDREHDLLDRDLRPFLEECDQLQALQILTGVQDAWGGFAAKYLERMADELGKGTRWVFGIQDQRRVTGEQQRLRSANIAQSTYALSTIASLHVPITSHPNQLPSYLSLDHTSRWHTSAFEAVLIESITLPSRLKENESARCTLNEIEAMLNNDGKRGVAASGFTVANPDKLHTEAKDDPITNGLPNGYHEDEAPDDDNKVADIDCFPEAASLGQAAGGRAPRRRRHIFSLVESLRGPWKTVDEIAETRAGARDRFAWGPRTTIYQTQLLLPILTSTPQIFHFEENPHKLAVKASLATSTAVADRIRSLELVARRMVGVDEREALCDGLLTMAEEYEEGWSDDDDLSEDE